MKTRLSLCSSVRGVGAGSVVSKKIAARGAWAGNRGVASLDLRDLGQIVIERTFSRRHHPLPCDADEQFGVHHALIVLDPSPPAQEGSDSPS